MPTKSEAEDHLRVIRSLMEKATIYRAISAPGALIGGFLSIATALTGFALTHPWFEVPHESCRFAVPWALVLVLTTIANIVLLRRDRRDGEDSFLSPRMTHTLRGMMPALLGGGLATLVESDGEQEGKWVWWHQNGQKSIQGEYTKGHPSGHWTWWNEDGKVARSTEMENGSGEIVLMPEKSQSRSPVRSGARPAGPNFAPAR